ncbi:MAG: RagB/SusD family nutrient uptake outer membrane protein [Bacteroidota bacterium]|nr:RagB/SusD family nutrient uptake outer membrane protein [Bacteroidota bacterium]
MKKYINIIAGIFVFLAITGLTSCTDYLDKSPDATVSSTDAFINFTNFQGFTEELYCCVPDFIGKTWATDWNLADEVLHKDGGIWLNDEFDKGNYWAWTTVQWISYLDAGSPNTSNNSTFDKGLWPNAWYGIRKANIGLANLDKLQNATQEEKDLIKGQLLFFRAWFHFELMTYWGGLPYIDRVLTSTEKLELPRLTYQQTADRVAEDLRAAADLLPVDWEKTAAGVVLTAGDNKQRITKMVALAYLGKNYLYAGSPLMNKASTGNASFDPEYCKKAAKAFGEMLSIVDSGDSWLKLVDFKDYSTLFYGTPGGLIPGGSEAVFQSPVYSSWFKGCPWGPSSIFQAKCIGAGYSSPNARYVENYGMANGLPISDPESGYNPADPWSNRDPRFYNDIVIDGDKIIKGSAPADKEKYRYAALYTGGAARDNAGASRTGYLLRKLTPMTTNDIDGYPNNYMHLSYMRLADVYLMYAEAVLQGYGTAISSDPDYKLTAEEAFNKVRTRCGASPIAKKYVADKAMFMSEIVRERAVELGFEGDFRFNDLRRWLMWNDKKYLEKTAVDFDRGANGKPINMKERVVTTRIFAEKNYWLPLKISDVKLYPSFSQNPGY